MSIENLASRPRTSNSTPPNMHANKLPNAEDIKEIEFAISDVSLTYIKLW